MASHDLGKLGAGEGQPVLVQWRWFDSKPTLPLWIALLLLLVVPKENRTWQAWLILVLPLSAVALRLFYFVPSLGSSADFDVLIQLIVTFAISWACVWLLAPKFSKGNRARTLFSAMAVMFVVGLVAYLSYFGFWCSSQAPAMVICYWIVGSVSLLLALSLSGVCCRGNSHPRVLSLWLVLWLPAITAVSMGSIFGAVITMTGGGPGISFLFTMILLLLLASLFVSGLLYAVNLPVMLLAGLTDCYRKRLQAMVDRDPIDGDLIGQTSLADGNPVEV